MTSTSSRLAFLVLAHLKVMVGGSIEFGNGFPPPPLASRSRAPVPVHRPGRSPPLHPDEPRVLLGPNTGTMITSKSQEFESLTIVVAFAM